jgi:hypothetical protein
VVYGEDYDFHVVTENYALAGTSGQHEHFSPPM